MAQLVKTINGLAIASVKTFNALAIASVKTIDGVDNTAGGGGSPAFSEIQTSTGQPSGTSEPITITVTTGNAIWVGVKWEDAARTISVTDSASNVYTPLTQANFGGQVYGQMFYCINATGGALTITVSYGSSTNFIRSAAIEMTGVTAFDVEAVPGTGNTGSTGTPAITSNASTANAVEVLIAMVTNWDGVACAPQAGWTEVYDPNAFEVQYFITSSANTYHGEGTLAASAPYTCHMCAFK